MQIQRAIDSQLRDFDRPDAPGVGVLVIKDGRVLYRKALGLADVEARTPITPRTNFRLASITKSFTAMAILILKEQGKLRLESPLSDFFPEFPAYGRAITVRQLLNHTSGLPDYASHLPPGQKEQLTDRDVLAILEAQSQGEFRPGERFEYSNSGYVLLGLLVEKASGKSFAAFLSEAIFQPLGMANTVLYEAGKSTVPRRAYGYTPEQGTFRRTDQSLTSATRGDGGIYSSLEDLFLWDQALYTRKLVGAETLKLAFTPGRFGAGQTCDYGFGWVVETVRGIRRISHGGGTIGFRNHFVRLPAQRFSVIVLTNRNDGPASQIANAIARLSIPALATPRPTVIRVPAPVLASYAGHYQMRGSDTTITARGGRLYWVGVGAKPIELLPLSRDTFFYADDDINPEHDWRLTFVRDTRGRITHFSYHAGGQEVFRAPYRGR